MSFLETTDTPPLKRAISQDGEVRKEYEEEMRKVNCTFIIQKPVLSVSPNG